MPAAPRPLVDRMVPKIAAPVAVVFDPWWETYPLLAAFYFDRTVCWEWTGAYSKKRGAHYDRGNDRPVIQTGRRGTPVVHVFRIMLALKDGIPLRRRRGYHACHREDCQNTRCVNPWHGYWGTPGRNHEDRERHAPDTFKRKAARS